jgi:hypothetical protein
MIKCGLHSLKLVFTPFSNQEGEWFRDDNDVRVIARESNLYMIGQRQETLFENYCFDQDSLCFKFDLRSGGMWIRGVSLPLNQFPQPDNEHYFYFELSPKFIRISHVSISGEPQTKSVVHWFTPNKLFYLYSRQEVTAFGLEDYRNFTLFYLYYVGISKKEDSFSRLFETAHANRSRILGNETQITPTARLTDELILFLFKVEDLLINMYGDEDFFNEDKPFKFEKTTAKEILASDAEKAFVKIMKSCYNTQQYASYPKSSDGLWGHGFTRYGFVIEEGLSFATEHEQIRGGLIYNMPTPELADMIMIEGESVTLFKC